MSIEDLTFLYYPSLDQIFDPADVSSASSLQVRIRNDGEVDLADLGLYAAPATNLGSVDYPSDFSPETDFQDLLTVGTKAITPDEASQVWNVSDPAGTPAWTDMTTEFNDAVDANYVVFPASEAVGDYAAWGFSLPVRSLSFDSAGGTAGVGGVVVWEYWDGSAWSALSDVVDGTTGFTAAVADDLEVEWTVPSDWATTTLNSEGPYYYVRARITTVYTTNPTYDGGSAQEVSGALKVTVGSDTTYFSHSAGSKYSNRIAIPDLDAGASTEVTVEYEDSAELGARRLFVELHVE